MNIKKIGFAVLGMLLIFAQAQTSRALNYSDLTGQGQGTSATYPYLTASLVNDHGTIYFISGTVKVPFTNWAAFVGLGYSLKNVVSGDLTNYTPSQTYVIKTAYAEHPWGSWLSYKGTVYYSSQTGLIGVPSAEVFASNGGQWPFVVKPNKYDIAKLVASPNLPVLTDADSRAASANGYQFSASPAGQNSASPTTVTGTAGSQASAAASSSQVSSGVTGALNVPTLSPSSTPSQFMFGNTSNQPIAAFNFTASGSPVTIQELDFTVSNSSGYVPVSWIQVNGQSGQFVSASSSLTGLNITVPLGGITIPVTANFPTVAPNIVPDNQTFTLNLAAVKYLSAGISYYLYPNVASNPMVLVASAPTLAMVPSIQRLTDNSVLIAKVTVTAGPGNGITLNQLPLTFTSKGFAYSVATTSSLTVTDDSGLSVQTSYGTFGLASSSTVSVSVVFNSDNFIGGNSSKTYDFYLPFLGTSEFFGNSSIVTQLGPSSSFIYSEPGQGIFGVNIPGGSGGANDILNYPTGSVSVRN